MERQNIEERMSNDTNFNVALHTVFIARENIPFLEEWIEHHYNLGVTCFMLYDNSAVQDFDEWDYNHGRHRGMIPGRINKYGLNYNKRVNMTDLQIRDVMSRIQSKYDTGVVNYIPWNKKNEDGLVQYFQLEAAADCHQRLKKTDNRWCVSIDMDEFLCTHNNSVNIQQVLCGVQFNRRDQVLLGEMRFKNRWSLISDEFNLNTTSPTVFKLNHVAPWTDSPGKYIYKIHGTAARFSSPHSIKTRRAPRRAKEDQVHIKHYCL